MAMLKVYSLDDEAEKQVICTLREGEHRIGRGETLKCTDKRVSRNHILINVTSTGASIKSIHVNPCFHRPKGGQIHILKLHDSTTPLNDDDQFGLLADSFWFKVKLVKEPQKEPPDEPNNNVNHVEEENNASSSSSAKRKVEDDLTTESKRQKNDVLDTTVENFDDSDGLLEGSYFMNATLRVGEDATSTVKDDEGAPNGDVVAEDPEAKAPNEDKKATDDPNEEKAETKVKVEPANDANDTNTATATTTTRTVRRDRCWYGASCYRRNPLHFQQFSHQGDNDYASDPEDDRSLCPFGAGCYNRSQPHRQRYKHTGPPAPRPTTSAKPAAEDDESDEDQSTPSQNKKKRKRKAAQKKKKYTDTPEDDYDHDDPFLNDDSSDDFEISDEDDDDDDWEDSQEPEEEDSQVTKTLVKEAKKFTKGKK